MKARHKRAKRDRRKALQTPEARAEYEALKAECIASGLGFYGFITVWEGKRAREGKTGICPFLRKDIIATGGQCFV